MIFVRLRLGVFIAHGDRRTGAPAGRGSDRISVFDLEETFTLSPRQDGAENSTADLERSRARSRLYCDAERTSGPSHMICLKPLDCRRFRRGPIRNNTPSNPLKFSHQGTKNFRRLDFQLWANDVLIFRCDNIFYLLARFFEP